LTGRQGPGKSTTRPGAQTAGLRLLLPGSRRHAQRVFATNPSDPRNPSRTETEWLAADSSGIAGPVRTARRSRDGQASRSVIRWPARRGPAPAPKPAGRPRCRRARHALPGTVVVVPVCAGF
jgi:hypothetical protein